MEVMSVTTTTIMHVISDGEYKSCPVLQWDSVALFMVFLNMHGNFYWHILHKTQQIKMRLEVCNYWKSNAPTTMFKYSSDFIECISVLELKPEDR